MTVMRRRTMSPNPADFGCPQMSMEMRISLKCKRCKVMPTSFDKQVFPEQQLLVDEGRQAGNAIHFGVELVLLESVSGDEDEWPRHCVLL